MLKAGTKNCFLTILSSSIEPIKKIPIVEKLAVAFSIFLFIALLLYSVWFFHSLPEISHA